MKNMVIFCLFAPAVAVTGSAETEFTCVESGRAVCAIGKTGNAQVIFDSYELKPLCSAERDED